jgi:flagellar biosynthetic protein FliQ
MPTAQVLDILRDLFYTAFLLALPSLLASLIVGLIISILQTITSIQEQTLSFAPRLIAVTVVMIFTMAWGIQLAVHFTYRIFSLITEVTR